MFRRYPVAFVVGAVIGVYLALGRFPSYILVGAAGFLRH